MSAARVAAQAIKIPKRIERGPTDILKALSSTVKFEPMTSRAIDDPFLVPRHVQEFRIFRASKISGIKAARYFLEKYPELFFRDDAEPKIEAFVPKEHYLPDMEFSEIDIEWCIRNRDGINAAIAYRSMQEKGQKLSKETMLDLLEMLCFTCETSKLDREEHEKNFLFSNQQEKVVWDKKGLAQEIFNELKGTADIDAPRIYSAMIAGLSRAGELEKARNLFEEYKQSHNQPLMLDAYDMLIRALNTGSSAGGALETLGKILEHMRDHSVKPNVLIFNSILQTHLSFDKPDQYVQSLNLFNDMQSLDVKPSLYSYAAMFKLSAYDRNKFRSLMAYAPELLGKIKDSLKSYDLEDTRDLNFLLDMMLLADRQRNMQLMQLIHQIYLQNPNLFSSAAKIDIYLRVMLNILINAGTLDEIMNHFRTYIPRYTNLGRDREQVLERLLEVMDLYQAPADFIKYVGQYALRMKIKVRDDSLLKTDPDYVEGLKKQAMEEQQMDK